jgi:hypothetical protein
LQCWKQTTQEPMIFFQTFGLKKICHRNTEGKSYLLNQSAKFPLILSVAEGQVAEGV